MPNGPGLAFQTPATISNSPEGTLSRGLEGFDLFEENTFYDSVYTPICEVVLFKKKQ